MVLKLCVLFQIIIFFSIEVARCRSELRSSEPNANFFASSSENSNSLPIYQAVALSCLYEKELIVGRVEKSAGSDRDVNRSMIDEYVVFIGH